MLAMLNRAETKRDVCCHPLSFSFAFTHCSLPSLRRSGTGSDYFVIFSGYSESRLYLSSGRCSPLTLACRCCSAGIFSGNTTNTSQCASCDRKNVWHLAEGIREAALHSFQACASSSHDQVGWVLSENSGIRCSYHHYGYVSHSVHVIPVGYFTKTPSSWPKKKVWTFHEELGWYSASWGQGSGSEKGTCGCCDISVAH